MWRPIGAAPFEVSLNSAAVPKEDHKLKARALVSVNGNLLEASQEFEVHVPKGATSSRDLNPLSSPSQGGTPTWHKLRHDPQIRWRLCLHRLRPPVPQPNKAQRPSSFRVLRRS